MFRCLTLLALPLLVTGCSQGPYQGAQVSGQVTLNGKPLANAAVLFQPVAVEGNINPGPGSYGVTDQEGRYTMVLVGKETKGAVVGKHKVRIANHDPTPQDPSEDA